MTFALDNDPDNSEISNSINYLLANLPVSLGQNISNGQITNSNGAVVSYLYKYLQVKYANSFDGTLGFSDVPTGTTYFGLRNSNSNVESTTPSDYVWTLVSGGFGISKHLYYVTTGGRQIQVFVGTTPPASYWGSDPGSAIDLDIISSVPNATGGGGALTMMGLDGESGEDGFPVPGPAGINGATGSQGPQGVATYLEAEVIEPEMFLVPGTPGPAGNPGAIGPAGSNGFGTDGEDGMDGMPIPGPMGPQGVQGIQGLAGSNGFGLDGVDGEDGLSIVGQQGPQGLQGFSGPAGTSALPIAVDGSDGDDGMPGPQGIQGIQGIAGTSGANGPAVYLEAEVIEPDFFVVPGPAGINGTVGVNGAAGPIVYLEPELPDDPLMIPGPQGPQGTSGGGGGSSAKGTAIVNFGAFPGSSDTSVTITGQASIAAGSVVIAQIYPFATADHSADEHFAETIFVTAGNVISGTGFTIYARNSNMLNEPVDYPPNSNTIVTSTGGTAIAVKNAQPGYRAYGGGIGTLIYGQWTVSWTWN